jgi:hypothetical protein
MELLTPVITLRITQLEKVAVNTLSVPCQFEIIQSEKEGRLNIGVPGLPPEYSGHTLYIPLNRHFLKEGE